MSSFAMPTKTRSTPKSSSIQKAGGPSQAFASDSSNDGSTAAHPLSSESIAARAYVIWQQKGCPEGCDDVNWHQAEQELSTQILAR